jgi:hypothetical protein
MSLPKFIAYFVASVLLASAPACAWGPDGHHAVGAIADSLIAGSHADAQVKAILGGISLQDASVWADCAKGVDPGKNYSYQTEGKYPECAVFETPQLEAEMSDFVRRNDRNCDPKPGAESCHKQYHYTDIAIQHERYSPSYTGSRDDDIVHAVVVAAHILKGEAAPAPFDIKGKREALLLLAHYVGDIHQPLHVGAVYLDKKGKRVDPDIGGFDLQTDTHGGNSLRLGGRANLHMTWDRIPAKLKAERLAPALLSQARSTHATKGKLYDWPAAWAGETLGAAKLAFRGVAFGERQNGQWSVKLPPDYGSDSNAVKEAQLLKAGARLAQLLQAIWP